MAHLLSFGLATALVCAAASPRPAPTFDTAVEPILAHTCALCHNAKVASGGMNITPFLSPASLVSDRAAWEQIVAKVASGEMPPKGVPHSPQEQIDALVNYVESEFDRADRAHPRDPGHITARRLNRAEYANSVRDLLGVHFRANEEFPPDDSGNGFDNNGDVLTVSPTLLNMYFIAAERIASRAVGGDPLPKPGVFDRRRSTRRLDAGTVELTDVVDYDADYIVRVIVTGHRGAQGKPVTLQISVDGKPATSAEIDTAQTLVNRQGGNTQQTTAEARVYLDQGPHTFRAEFVHDDALNDIAPERRNNSTQNIFPSSFEIGGPYPAREAHTHSRPFLLCDPASGPACVERILAPLARRAYRRPVTRAEVAELVKVDQRALAAGYTPAQGLQFALSAMLVSPRFLFRIERDPKPGAVSRVSDFELAARLSYFLWSSMPDNELLRLAAANKLHTPAVLDAQVTRMLADPKSSALAENFAGQWLEIRSLDAAKPDPQKFPTFTPDLKEAMRTETTMFFDAVLHENRPISDFIDGKYTFLNALLAKHYGVKGVDGGRFRRVELTGDERSGVLTQASVLTVSSYASRTSVVLRGKYLLENILGAPPPPPPADVPPLDEAAVGSKQSLRQQMETHRANAVCASCHARMDVLGFGLENYDAVGHWRTEDGKFPVDPAGTFPNGKSFKTPAEMKALLRANLPDFARCIIEKMLTYALGRGVESYDRLAVRDMVREAAASDYRFQSIIHGIVHSVPFQERRAAAGPETKAPRQEIARK